MRVAGLAFLLVIAACSAQTGAQPSPATESAAVPFNCRLPVVWFNQDPAVDGKTGFVTFPAATLSAPTGSPPKPAQFTYRTSYDRTVERWLPVSGAAVAPDGLHYAYADYDQPAPNDLKAGVMTGRVHIVDARSGDDRVVYSGSPFAVVDYTAAGLYLARLTTAQYAPQRRGLYFMDPADGIPHLVPGSDVQLDFGGWRALDGDAAWGTRYSNVGGMASGNELFRVDVKTGEVARWLAVPTDHSLYVLGFDPAGNPLVSSTLASFTTGQSMQTSVVVVTGPDQSTQLFSSDAQGPGELGVADTHGIWIGGGGSIWLYQPASGIRPIQVLADPNTVVEVGGACS